MWASAWLDNTSSFHFLVFFEHDFPHCGFDAAWGNAEGGFACVNGVFSD